MNLVLEATLHSLKKTKWLLTILSNASMRDVSVAPYHASIGSHIRHVLDYYDCIFEKEGHTIDLSARKRDRDVECYVEQATNYLNRIITKCETFESDLNNSVRVIDDLGLGKIEITYTYEAVFAQAISHTNHHFAIINYIMSGLGIVITDKNFGYNPTTPKLLKFND